MSSYDQQAQDSPQQENVEGEDNTQVVDAGVPGQIQYPDREVYAERAAAFAAGKERTLYPEEETGDRQVYATHWDADRETGDESGEETEPLAMRGGDDEEDR